MWWECMREIKFRFWNKKKKLYDDYLFIDENGVVNEMDYEFLIEREEIELEQYTGLNDKNNKEIYEGDILNFYYQDGSWFGFGVCYYDNDETMFRHSYHEVHDNEIEYDSQRPSKRFWSNQSIVCEIIGNVHENPELIEKYLEITGKN